MTTTETAWLAGIYEGEGCLHKDKRKKATYRINIVMTDKDIIERLVRVSGIGKVGSQTKQEAHHKDQYRWTVHKKQDIRSVLSSILPYLGDRRAHDALNALDAIEL